MESSSPILGKRMESSVHAEGDEAVVDVVAHVAAPWGPAADGPILVGGEEGCGRYLIEDVD